MEKTMTVHSCASGYCIDRISSRKLQLDAELFTRFHEAKRSRSFGFYGFLSFYLQKLCENGELISIYEHIMHRPVEPISAYGSIL